MMSTEFFKKSFVLYEIKRNKYKGQKINDKLDNALWQEALIEAKASEVYSIKKER